MSVESTLTLIILALSFLVQVLTYVREEKN